MACGVLHALGRGQDAAARFAARANVEQVLGMLLRGTRCPPTSSLGRWFDAAAGLLGVCEITSYEGQAAMMLEALARRFGACLPLPGGYHIDGRGGAGPSMLSLYPLLRQLAEENDAARGAAHFHATVVEALSHWIGDAAHATDVRRVALAGGCLHNRLLASGLRQRLQARGLSVYEARYAPPGDGGLALGQAWVARAILRQGAI